MSWEDSTPDERQASTSRMAYKEMGRANELQKKLDAAVRRAIASEDLLMSRAQQHADAESEATRLRAKLLDAKRNEERAVAEVGELKLFVDHAMMEVPGYDSDVHTDRSKLPGMVHSLRQSMLDEEDKLRVETRNFDNCHKRLEEMFAKLNTLEAAVRAVRDDEHIEWYHDLHPDQALSKLYALVPEAGS